MKPPISRHWKMPKAFWVADHKVLNWQQKRFLAFIWWCAPEGCHCWNGRLSKRFKVSPRTIQRWVSNLNRLGLIAIGFPDGSGRTIWPRYQAKLDCGKPVKSSVKRLSRGDINVAPR